MRSAWICLSMIVAATLAAAPLARAEVKQWRIVPAQSTILFEYQSDTQPAKGEFNRFSGEGVFHPESPDKARFELKIRSGSIDLRDARASAFATSAEWFDSANYPDLVYQLQRLTPIEANRYRAEGELTIRGTTRPLTTTITLEIGQREAHASGTLTVNRKDFGLGVGPMSLFVDIGPEVSVHFELTAHPVG